MLTRLMCSEGKYLCYCGCGSAGLDQPRCLQPSYSFHLHIVVFQYLLWLFVPHFFRRFRPFIDRIIPNIGEKSYYLVILNLRF
jgi:hypothetical protein